MIIALILNIGARMNVGAKGMEYAARDHQMIAMIAVMINTGAKMKECASQKAFAATVRRMILAVDRPTLAVDRPIPAVVRLILAVARWIPNAALAFVQMANAWQIRSLAHLAIRHPVK
mmetsp:Transcript_17652/g.33190  ORF Transcript_17652/g.33190 Transcript_17652/m.33190 type:complete len:118 (+) Transcript_17652:948-1301(+)